MVVGCELDESLNGSDTEPEEVKEVRSRAQDILFMLSGDGQRVASVERSSVSCALSVGSISNKRSEIREGSAEGNSLCDSSAQERCTRYCAPRASPRRPLP